MSDYPTVIIICIIYDNPVTLETRNKKAPELGAVLYSLSIKSALMSMFMVLYRENALLPSL